MTPIEKSSAPGDAPPRPHPPAGASASPISPLAEPGRTIALRVAGVYAVAAGLWILLSDRLLQRLVPDPALARQVAAGKDWLFVGLTALLLYGTLRRQLHASAAPPRTGLARRERQAGTRRQAEAAPGDREASLADIIDAAVDAIITLDGQQRIVRFNPAAEKMFGCAAAEAVGRPLDRLLPERFREAHAAQIDAFARTGATTRQMGRLGVVFGRRASGAEFPLEASISQVEVGGQRLLTVILRDISERVQLEERLEQTHKLEAIGQLAGGVAHDFNNLLTVITGYADLLRADLAPDDPRCSPLDEVLHAASQASALTRQLLAFGRKQVLEPRVLDLNQAVGRTERLLRRLVGEGVVLETALAPSLSRIRMDPAQLEQILINLAVNSREAMPHGGRLILETREVELSADQCRLYSDARPGRYVLLSITDTGSGMTPEVQSRIFEPFFTTKGLGKGTGLGLASVFGIVKQSEGLIEVASELGRGTCFQVFLPAAPAADTPPQVEAALALRPGSETILLVEDEDQVREIARISLEGHGYRVLPARNGRHALELADGHPDPIHLLLTDVVMPEMDGGQLAEHLLARRAALKVLFMSGYTDDAMVRRGIVEGKERFLQKPFTPRALALKVRDVLDTQR